MVVFTKELSGIVITDTDEIVHDLPIFNGDLKFRNRNKFNKAVIKNKKPAHSNERYELNITREDYAKKRQDRKELMDLQNELKEDMKKDVKENKKRREEAKKRKQENENKNMSFQVITDNKKIKKMNRRIRSKIIRMPAEHFEKYLQRSKRNYE